MGKHLGLIVVFIAVPGLVLAYTSYRWHSLVSAQSHGLTISKSNIDIGPIWQGTVAHCAFEAKNNGSGILNIRDITGSCGCLSTKADCRKLSPGQIATITVDFDSRGHWRDTYNQVVIVTDEPSPFYIVKIHSFVRTDVRLDFDRLEMGGGYFGERLSQKAVHLVADRLFGHPPVTAVGNSKDVTATVGPWRDLEDISVCQITFASDHLSETVGEHVVSFAVTVGSHKFTVKALYQINRSLAASPQTITISRSSGRDALASLTSSSDIQILKITSLFGICDLTVSPAVGHAFSLTAHPKSGRKGDFDSLKIEYKLRGLDRHEDMLVPVLLIP